MNQTQSAQPPWVKLGRRIEHAKTASEAIKEIGLDFRVVTKPLQAILNGRSRLDVPKQFATVRLDPNPVVLGTVGSKYQVIQNSESFSWFDEILRMNKAEFYSGGIVGNGEKVWLLAKLNGVMRIQGKDPVERTLILYSSHDGSSNIHLKAISHRIVCSNAIMAALRGRGPEIKIRHTLSAHDRIEQARSILGELTAYFNEIEFLFNRLQLRRVTDKELLDYVKKLIVSSKEEGETSTKTERIRDQILYLHQNGKGAELTRGTAFGLLNSAVEYVDSYAGSDNASRALRSVWFGGSGERLKLRAFDQAIQLIGN